MLCECSGANRGTEVQQRKKVAVSRAAVVAAIKAAIAAPAAAVIEEQLIDCPVFNGRFCGVPLFCRFQLRTEVDQGLVCAAALIAILPWLHLADVIASELLDKKLWLQRFSKETIGCDSEDCRSSNYQKVLRSLQQKGIGRGFGVGNKGNKPMCVGGKTEEENWD
ncbi:hypothetical protein F0562_025475 [Nyssa sinensis]|uniref:Uncharacterized protein n=1 Tax=Nyssa sinensis TaxID=561372 RepID=A0A5J5B6A4_9ASTE|nr:hypothetical protein F0562_025475 [Nyssa sinensis]